MNQVIIDGCVQQNPKLFDNIASFNIASITGKFKLMNNKEQNRFTYIRVIYPKPISEYLENLLQTDSMVRVYGKLDCERYETSSGKVVYNKIICANKIVKIHYNKDTLQYEEVI